VVPTHNDTDEEFHKIASFIANELNQSVPWHISAFHPDYKELELPRTPLETLKRARSIGESYGLKHIHLGNVGGLL
jgi:pyruvate formate lyase activating enzyme